MYYGVRSLRAVDHDLHGSLDLGKTGDCRKARAELCAQSIGRRLRDARRPDVPLERDPTQDNCDKYDRLLRYIWLQDGRMYNYEMIAQGYAHEYTYNTPYRYRAEFKAAERRAREQGVGLWSPTTCAGDTEQPADAVNPGAAPPQQPDQPPAPQPTQPQQASSGNCDLSYPDICIPSPPPDLNCGEIQHRRFRVVPPDPQGFGGNGDGVGCESG